VEQSGLPAQRRLDSSRPSGRPRYPVPGASALSLCRHRPAV